jgi:hypothetical protein
MRWFYLLFGVSVMVLFVGVALSRFFLPLVVLGSAFWLIMGNSVRCPRCRRHVLDNGRGYYAPWIKTPARCVGCDRRKDEVWPFQWLLRPEREPTG